MKRKQILEYKDLNKKKNLKIGPAVQKNLNKNFELADGGNKYARKFIGPDSSSTRPPMTDRNRLFSVREKIKEMRRQDLSLEELFNIFLLTSRDASQITISIDTTNTKKYRVGNCAELSYFAMKYLRRFNRSVYGLSIIDSDHIIVMIGEVDKEDCVILDTLNEIFYPLSEIYKFLQCYEFDEYKTNPHVLSPFSKAHQLYVDLAVPCFTSGKYNQALLNDFYIKLDMIEKSFRKFSQSEALNQNFAETIEKDKLEVKTYDLGNFTNLKMERWLDRKIKNIRKIININLESKNIENKEEFFFDVMMNMRALFHRADPYAYFKQVLYFEPLFSAFLHYLKNQNNLEASLLKDELKNKNLLNRLLKKTIRMENPIIREMNVIRTLIEYGAAPDTDCGGYNVLSWAIKKNRKDVVEFLINQKKLLESPDPNGALPLNLAVKLGRSKLVTLMLDNMPDLIDKQDQKGLTPIHHAIKRNRIDIVKALLLKNPNLTLAANNDVLPLHRAVWDGNLEIAQLIIDHKPSCMNDQMDGGKTALHFAVKGKHFNIVELFLNHKSHVIDINCIDAYGWTSLHYAVHYGYVEIVEALLKHGAWPDIKDNKGQTALERAQASNQPSKILKQMNVLFQQYKQNNQVESLAPKIKF